ncbi:hypothetical protein [Synechococcus sp. MIT S1220]|uniref:hypothetical protein n=1 Tax=Synechococcus sp. MIT S1220 TaxID=3082549 RepID=UPI0039AFDEF1
MQGERLVAVATFQFYFRSHAPVHFRQEINISSDVAIFVPFLKSPMTSVAIEAAYGLIT